MASNKLKIFFRETYLLSAKHNMSCMCAQLTYGVIVAIVPFLAVVFSFIHSRKNFEAILNSVINPFILDNFGEKVGSEISSYIHKVVLNVQITELSVISFVSFLVTVILLLLLLESVFNTILDARKEKNYFISLLKCWLLLVFSPFLFVLITVRSEFLLDVLNLTARYDIHSSTKVLSYTFGYISQTIFFALLYIIMPSRRPNFTAAVFGAIMTTIALDLIRYINIYLVKHALNTDTSQLYGSVPLIAILFFVWLRIVIYVVLLGFVFTTAAEQAFVKKRHHKKS